MFVTSFPEYARNIQSAIDNLLATGEALLIDLQIDARSTLQGFIAGALQLEDGAELHFREFIDVRRSDPRLMYAYHYQDANKDLVFRYDNARHRPALPQAEHRHTLSGIEPSHAPTFQEVLDEILA